MSVNSIDAQPFWALIFCCCFLFGFVAAAFLKNIILNLHEYHPQTDSTHTQKAGDVCIRKCISVMLPCTPFSLFTIGVLFYHLHTREKNQSAAAHRHTLWAYGKFEAYRFTIFFLHLYIQDKLQMHWFQWFLFVLLFFSSIENRLIYCSLNDIREHTKHEWEKNLKPRDARLLAKSKPSRYSMSFWLWVSLQETLQRSMSMIGWIAVMWCEHYK